PLRIVEINTALCQAAFCTEYDIVRFAPVTTYPTTIRSGKFKCQGLKIQRAGNVRPDISTKTEIVIPTDRCLLVVRNTECVVSISPQYRSPLVSVIPHETGIT